MPNDKLLTKIFEHQRLLTQEMRDRLKKHLTEPLEQAFCETEKYLNFLINQDTVDTSHLQQLQKLWDKLTKEIETAQRSINMKLDTLNAQAEMTKLYQH
jgi:hypothetical protein